MAEKMTEDARLALREQIWADLRSKGYWSGVVAIGASDDEYLLTLGPMIERDFPVSIRGRAGSGVPDSERIQEIEVMLNALLHPYTLDDLHLFESAGDGDQYLRRSLGGGIG